MQYDTQHDLDDISGAVQGALNAIRPPALPSLEVSAAQQEVRRRIHTAQQASRPQFQRLERRTPSWPRLALGGAAAAAIAAVFSITGLPSSNKLPQQSQIQRVYTTLPGQQAIVTLGDGSEVMLAPQSRVQIPQDFAQRHRTLSLSGEAYFNVVSTAGAPFVVQAGTVATKVLGTAFTVRYLTADSTVDVAVVSGRVSVEGRVGGRQTVTLDAGDIAHVADSVPVKTQGDLSTYAGWKHGHLVFENAPVATVLASMGRWYGYRFTIADTALLQERISATFRIDRRSETLMALQDVLDASLSYNGNEILIRPRRHAKERQPARQRTNTMFTHNNVERGK